jgi:hypothetical protein
MGKLINAAKGLGLGLKNIKVFDLSYFHSKRIAIVGPANSAFNTNKGSYIDGFDIVVRMNKSPMTIAEEAVLLTLGVRQTCCFIVSMKALMGAGGHSILICIKSKVSVT